MTNKVKSSVLAPHPAADSTNVGRQAPGATPPRRVPGYRDAAPQTAGISPLDKGNVGQREKPDAVAAPLVVQHARHRSCGEAAGAKAGTRPLIASLSRNLVALFVAACLLADS